MSSTVIEKTQPTDDRLEIVVRKATPLPLLRRVSLVAMGSVWLPTLAYSLYGIYFPEQRSQTVFLALLFFSGFVPLLYFFIELHYLGTLLRVIVGPQQLVILRDGLRLDLSPDDIKAIEVDAIKTDLLGRTLELTINLVTGVVHTVKLNPVTLLRNNQLGALFSCLEALGKPVRHSQETLQMLRLRLPEFEPLDPLLARDAIGEERVRLTITKQPDHARRVMSFSHPFPLLAIFNVALFTLLWFLIPFKIATLVLFSLALYASALYCQKAVQMIVGTKGLGIAMEGRYALAFAFKDLQTVRFTDSKLRQDIQIVKASIRLLNGEELRFELSPSKPEDRETLRQIAQEFKELKHGD